MTKVSVWSGDWEKRLFDSLERQGFGNDAIFFAKSNPDLTYKELVELLDASLAPIQIVYLLTEQAQESNEIDWFSKDCFIRQVQRQCASGWKVGSKADYNAASAIADWICCMKRFSQETGKIASCVGIKLIKSTVLPEGWLPNNTDDIVIQEIFKDVSFSNPKLIDDC
ncbi:MAG: hypothetical protein AAGG51_12045 [Cyanobacteria bacterium P01_G01_bin.54]